MDGRFTEPRDLRPQLEADAPLRRERAEIEAVPSTTSEDKTLGRVPNGPHNATARVSRVFFFVMAAIIALAIAVFLILHPQAGD